MFAHLDTEFTEQDLKDDVYQVHSIFYSVDSLGDVLGSIGRIALAGWGASQYYAAFTKTGVSTTSTEY